MMQDDSSATYAEERHTLVIVDRLSELDWLVEVVNEAAKGSENANQG